MTLETGNSLTFSVTALPDGRVMAAGRHTGKKTEFNDVQNSFDDSFSVLVWNSLVCV